MVVVSQFFSFPISGKNCERIRLATWGWNPPRVLLRSSTSSFNSSNLGPQRTKSRRPLIMTPLFSHWFNIDNAHWFLAKSVWNKNVVRLNLCKQIVTRCIPSATNNHGWAVNHYYWKFKFNLRWWFKTVMTRESTINFNVPSIDYSFQSKEFFCLTLCGVWCLKLPLDVKSVKLFWLVSYQNCIQVS